MPDVGPQITTDAHQIRSMMVFSALLSLLVLIVVLLGYAEHPREPGRSWSYEKGTSIFDVGYVIALTATAFAGALLKKRWIGYIHAALLSGVSINCIVSGLATFNDKSIMGGHGPDANPAAGVSYAVAIGVVLAGLFCAAVTIALCLAMARPVSTKSVYPQRPSL